MMVYLLIEILVTDKLSIINFKFFMFLFQFLELLQKENNENVNRNKSLRTVEQMPSQSIETKAFAL